MGCLWLACSGIRSYAMFTDVLRCSKALRISLGYSDWSGGPGGSCESLGFGGSFGFLLLVIFCYFWQFLVISGCLSYF